MWRKKLWRENFEIKGKIRAKKKIHAISFNSKSNEPLFFNTTYYDRTKKCPQSYEAKFLNFKLAISRFEGKKILSNGVRKNWAYIVI